MFKRKETDKKEVDYNDDGSARVALVVGCIVIIIAFFGLMKL